MTRESMLQILHAHGSKKWDMVIIGGGATGLGCALDAVTRGYKTLLLEKFDFAKGTSSKSTKLVHGGVRYLAQGNFKLVNEALRERGYLIKNAPHLVKNLTLDVPAHSLFQQSFYYAGLSLYDFMAGNYSFGHSKWISKKQILKDIPTLKGNEIRGGISFQDGQFDDARLAINLMQSIADHGGVVINYAEVLGFTKDKLGSITGLKWRDLITQEYIEVNAKVVINATGVLADSIMQLDEPAKPTSIIASQGTHIVLDKKFLPSNRGLMIPKTKDGRVLFALPFYDKTIIGTTDNKVENISLEPKPLESEIDFILETARKYLQPTPTRADIFSAFAGLRPLAAPSGSNNSTKEISRGHKITISRSGLINIIGGKWTTYRKMAEDTVNKAMLMGRLLHSDCKTKDLNIHGFALHQDPKDHLHIYGADADEIHALQHKFPELNKLIHPDLPYTFAEIKWAIEHEMAVTLEDILARRTRSVLLNAVASIEAAPEVARFMANLMSKDESWISQQVSQYSTFADGYIVQPINTSR